MNDIDVYELVNYTESETSTNEKYSSRLLWWEDNIVGTYLGIVCIIALVLNFLVIYTCFKNWNSLLVSDYYILNLACSDVLLPTCAFPLPISASFFHRWVFGDTGCVLYGFLGFFFGVVSITTLTIMGLTRYLSVCHPHLRAPRLNSTKGVFIFTYVYALIWSTIPLIGWGSYSMESYGTSCTLQWDENRVFITLMSLFCISTPSAFMFFSYTMIVLKCRKSNRSLREWQAKNSQMSRKESYLIKITFAMCWGFIVCWMPYAIVSMWTAYGDATYIPVRLTVVAVLLAKTSTVVNPFIYFLMNNKFRPLLLRSLKLESGKQRNLKETKIVEAGVELLEQERPKFCESGSSNTYDSSASLEEQARNMKVRVTSEKVAL